MLENKSSTDIDGFNNVLFKNILESVCVIICHMFNLSFSAGIVRLKQTVFITLYKKEESKLSDNYRPISLLPILSNWKFMEKLMKSRLLKFLNNFS